LSSAIPLARMTALSLVLVSPSTVTQLKVTSVTSRSAASRASDVAGASVMMTDSMVPMLMWIMPEPLASPVTVKGLPVDGSTPLADERFGIRSVVIIAREARSRASAVPSSSASAFSYPRRIRSIGSRCPITPVDITSPASACGPEHSRDISSASARPAEPVTAFAHPALPKTVCGLAEGAAGGEGKEKKKK
jgi:hypothetical protein